MFFSDNDLKFRSEIFNFYCVQELLKLIESEISNKDLILRKLKERTLRIDPNLSGNLLEYFAEYLGIIKDQNYFNKITFNLVLIGLSITVLEQYEGKVYYNNKGFFTTSGPFEIFKHFLTLERINTHFQKAIDTNIYCLKTLRTWIDDAYEFYSLKPEMLIHDFHDAADKLKAINL
jgi:hypothetical protein